ncbi:hypothetical protein GCM10012320_22530 [Sinomonas cellulolyticus]|uniref:SGNH/GDSL hydrolase family protein n=1 Tax=Sinomonas cellulolyticus TaxID=2801916 RepID=A0ABS1K637_9MICC|nr:MULTISPECIES: SGNH/GDSL hydrolase family protein [Sinomonas]MBL0705761.1 SGNH/GDSL hydrolase family protein [Sinomonas cellulolyticus]GHG52299.1 hypothetical protein GCM10012320_22530 [Sinomonas sp. KCTC 49339]
MKFTRIRRLGAAVAAAITLIAAGGAAAPAVAAPAAPQSGWYYALGDSYAAGVGGGTPIDDCGRTAQSYPADLGAKKNIACSGATTADVIRQAKTLPTNTGYVTVTAGGNDLGLSSITAACLAADPNNPLTWGTCLGQLGAAEQQLGTVGANIPAIVTAIHAKSPNAQIVFTGYPHLFLTGLSPLTDQVNAGIDALDSTIWAAATGAGAQYVDVRLAFTGHELGSADPWINGPEAGSAAFHPNATGYAYGYAPVVGAALAALGWKAPALVG